MNNSETTSTFAEAVAINGLPPVVAAALVKAQGEIRAVEKDSKNNHHNYKYASADDLVGEARQALGKADLALLQAGWRMEHPAEHDAPSRIVVTYLLVHTSGHVLRFCTSTPIIPDKGRPEDKAEATALTYNLGYTVRGLLLIPRSDEGADVDRRDDKEYQPRTGNAQRGAFRERSSGQGQPSMPAPAPTAESIIKRLNAATTMAEVKEAKAIASRHYPKGSEHFGAIASALTAACGRIGGEEQA